MNVVIRIRNEDTLSWIITLLTVLILNLVILLVILLG